MTDDNIRKIKGAFEAAEDVAPKNGLTPPDNAHDGPHDAPPRTPDDIDASVDPRDPGPMQGDIDNAIEHLLEEGALLPLNDAGNGRRFALYFGEEAMYVPRVGWHVWDRRRWKLDPDNILIRRHAQELHRLIQREIPYIQLNSAERRRVDQLDAVRAELRAIDASAVDLSDDDRATRKQDLLGQKDKLNSSLWGKGSSRSRHVNFGNTSGNKGRIDAAMSEAITRLSQDVDDLDADPLTVNTETGILRFTVADMRAEGAGKVAEVRLLDHERVVSIEGRNQPQYITKMMPVAYDPAATCPKFEAFLERVQPNPDMRAFLQRWFGLSMTGLQVQKYLYCYGMGANGKSLLANLMRRLMGDYATMVRIESLTGQNRKSGSDATPDMMPLIGARSAFTSEPGEGQLMQEQKMKELTGGDELLVRALHADFVRFTPYFKLMFIGNYKLDIRGTDDGIWRRTLLCPFDVQIPDDERDEKLGDRLFEEERSGILNWMIKGLLDYLEGGLQEPEQVLQATEEYRKDSDPIGDFLATACVIDGGTEFLPARDLGDACYLYLLDNTSHPWQPGRLSRKLKERSGKYTHPKTGKGFTRHKRNGTWGYCGIQLTTEWRRRLDAAPRDHKGLPQLRRDDSGGSGSAGGNYPL
jgi:putative DNA primase/helicase